MIIPCIHFQGNCDEAINFYKEVFGAEVNAIDLFRNLNRTQFVVANTRE